MGIGESQVSQQRLGIALFLTGAPLSPGSIVFTHNPLSFFGDSPTPAVLRGHLPILLFPPT